MGTNFAKMSGPVTLGSVGFTGKAFTSGAPVMEAGNNSILEQFQPFDSCLFLCLSTANLKLTALQHNVGQHTFYGGQCLQRWHRFMVNEVIVFFGRIKSKMKSDK